MNSGLGHRTPPTNDVTVVWKTHRPTPPSHRCQPDYNAPPPQCRDDHFFVLESLLRRCCYFPRTAHPLGVTLDPSSVPPWWEICLLRPFSTSFRPITLHEQTHLRTLITDRGRTGKHSLFQLPTSPVLVPGPMQTQRPQPRLDRRPPGPDPRSVAQ